MENFKLLHRSQLDAIQIVETVVTNIKDFEPMKAEETSRVAVFVELAE